MTIHQLRQNLRSALHEDSYKKRVKNGVIPFGEGMIFYIDWSLFSHFRGHEEPEEKGEKSSLS